MPDAAEQLPLPNHKYDAVASHSLSVECIGYTTNQAPEPSTVRIKHKSGVEETLPLDYFNKNYTLAKEAVPETAGQYGPLMRAAKQAEILDLLVALHNNTTVAVKWSEDSHVMNVEAINNLLRNNRDVLLNALQVYGFDSYADAMEKLHI